MKIIKPRSSDYSTYKKISHIQENTIKQFITKQMFLPSYNSFCVLPKVSTLELSEIKKIWVN